MKLLKKLILYLALTLVLIVPLVSSAVDCDPKTGEPPKGSAVCNPTPGFFVDLTGKPQGNTFAGLLLFIIQAALGVVGLVFMAFIIIGGFQYITSRGNEEQAEAGKKTLTNAIIGLVIVILSYIILAVIVNALFGKT